MTSQQSGKEEFGVMEEHLGNNSTYFKKDYKVCTWFKKGVIVLESIAFW